MLEAELVAGMVGVSVSGKLMGTIIPSVAIPITHRALTRRPSVEVLLSQQRREKGGEWRERSSLAKWGLWLRRLLSCMKIVKSKGFSNFEDESLGSSSRYLVCQACLYGSVFPGFVPPDPPLCLLFLDLLLQAC